MKKLITFPLKKKLYKGLGKAAAVILLLGMSSSCPLQVSAEEINRTESYVYHQHQGSPEEEGGCYHRPIYHEHTGDETAGGGCYGTAVYHVHQGDETAGGGCYGTAVYHEHEGNGEEEGGCYVKKPHKHVSSCYKTVSSEEYGCYVIRTEDTNDDDYEGHDYKNYYMSCGKTVHGTNASHGHTVLDCKKTYDSGYQLGCSKTEESIESYLQDCGRTEGETIDSYALNCGRTTENIEGYGVSCGRDEETPIGKITVTEEKGSKKEETFLKASFEDLSDGSIHLSEEAFTWQDASGNALGTGENIRVSENGRYSLVLGIENEDVNRDSLKAEITIRSIVKPSKNTGGQGKDDHDNGDNGGGGDNGGNTDDNGSGDNNGGNGEAAGATPTPVPTPTAASATASSPIPLKSSQGAKSQSTPGRENTAETAKKTKAIGTPAPVLTWQKKAETVELPDKQSGNVEIPQIEIKEQKRGFGLSGMAAVVTVTAGTILASLGLLFLLYYLRMSVKVYNDDGKGGMIYLGRCRVKLAEEGYTITISDEMEEKAVTNRYYIRPGLFRLFKGEEEELIVCRLKKKISVYLNKEMTVVI